MAYSESSNILTISFEEDNINGTEREKTASMDINNTYVNKVLLERNGNNCSLSIELTQDAKYYNIYEDSTFAKQDKLLIADISFKTNTK